MLILNNDLWKGFHESEDYKAIQEDYKDSYIWDRLIEYYTNDLLNDGMFDMHSEEVTDNELALVAMALQPRSYRAVLAEAFMEFLQKPELKVASRAAKGYLDTAFVFLIGKSLKRWGRATLTILNYKTNTVKTPLFRTYIELFRDKKSIIHI